MNHKLLSAFAILLGLISLASTSPLDGPSINIIPAPNADNSTNLERRDLGTCIDICDGYNYEGPGAYDLCTGPESCIQIAGFWPTGVSSVRFYGDTSCDLFHGTTCEDPGCIGGACFGHLHITQATPDLRKGTDYDNTVRSIKCRRQD